MEKVKQNIANKRTKEKVLREPAFILRWTDPSQHPTSPPSLIPNSPNLNNNNKSCYLLSTYSVPCALSFLFFFLTSLSLSFFLGPHQGHMEIPRLGVKLEL